VKTQEKQDNVRSYHIMNQGHSSRMQDSHLARKGTQIGDLKPYQADNGLVWMYLFKRLFTYENDHPDHACFMSG